MAAYTVVLLDEANSQAKAMTSQGAAGDVLKSNGVDVAPTWLTPPWVLPGSANHDEFSDFVGDEHIDHTGITLTAGVGLTGGGTIAANRTFDVNVGIADDRIVQIDDADVADNDYAKFTANGLEGRSYAEVKTDLGLNNVENIAISGYGGSTNIVTVGTIGAGTWNATAIADGKIASASTWNGKIANLSEDTTPDLGGNLDAGANWIGFTEQNVTYSSGTTTVNWGNGNKARIIMTGNITTLAFTNPPTAGNFLLILVHSGGGRTISGYDADIKWFNGGTAPTLSTGSGDIDAISGYFDGTKYHCMFSGDSA